MQLPPNAHVAVVDGTRFLLFRADSGDALVFEDEPDVSDSGESGARGHHDTEAKSDDYHTQDKLDHAAGVAGWLNHSVSQHKIAKLLIVADPDTLGEMRRHYDKGLEAALVGEIDKLLTGMPGPDIAKAIAAA